MAHCILASFESLQYCHARVNRYFNEQVTVVSCLSGLELLDSIAICRSSLAVAVFQARIYVAKIIEFPLNFYLHIRAAALFIPHAALSYSGREGPFILLIWNYSIYGILLLIWNYSIYGYCSFGTIPIMSVDEDDFVQTSLFSNQRRFDRVIRS